MNFIRTILLPVSFLYGLLLFILNKLFDWYVLKSESMNIPIISVGNLSAGGTGKTPHVEYLVRLLQDIYQIAYLSRGYKRKTNTFVLASEKKTVLDIGDEPYQFFINFPKVIVAVDKDRVDGINMLRKIKSDIEIILLDDAFQHRYIQPGLSILLTDYHHLYTDDLMLPSGMLREFKSGAARADIIIVTKTPKIFSPILRRHLFEVIKPKGHQQLFFSYIEHGNLTPLNPDLPISELKNIYTILLVSGIANTYPLEEHLKRICVELEILNFQDHHFYDEKDLDTICQRFYNLYSKNKLIITTEKDAVKFRQPHIFKKISHLPIYYIPIEVCIHKEEQKEFDKIILDYVAKSKRNH